MFIWAVSALTFWLLPGGIAPDVLACADFGNPHTHVPNVAAVMSSLYLSQAHAAHPASLLDSAMFKDATWYRVVPFVQSARRRDQGPRGRELRRSDTAVCERELRDP